METPNLEYVESHEIVKMINKLIDDNKLRLKTDMGRDNNQFVEGELAGLVKLLEWIIDINDARIYLRDE
jgi:hypothetical protein